MEDEPTQGQVETSCFVCPPAISLTGNNLVVFFEMKRFSSN